MLNLNKGVWANQQTVSPGRKALLSSAARQMNY